MLSVYINERGQELEFLTVVNFIEQAQIWANEIGKALLVMPVGGKSYEDDFWMETVLPTYY
jgi:hypothetical protein